MVSGLVWVMCSYSPLLDSEDTGQGFYSDFTIKSLLIIIIIIYLAQIDLHLQRVASIHWLEVFSYRLSDELDFAAVFSSSDILPKRWCSSWNVYFVGVEKRFFQYTLIVSSDNVRYERSLLPVDKAAWVFRFRNFL